MLQRINMIETNEMIENNTKEIRRAQLFKGVLKTIDHMDFDITDLKGAVRDIATVKSLVKTVLAVDDK
jgi:hypothetical protein